MMHTVLIEGQHTRTQERMFVVKDGGLRETGCLNIKNLILLTFFTLPFFILCPLYKII